MPAHSLLAVAAAPAAFAGLSAAGCSARRRWRRHANTDALTGLGNGRLFDSRVHHAILRAQRHNAWVAVLAIDVDELATTNNTLGRQHGDRLLRSIAQRLSKVARAEDTVVRFGSDEFMVLLEEVEDPTGAARAAQRILDAVEQPHVIDGERVAASVSVGIAVDRGGSTLAGQMIDEAGIALGRAKARGKRRFETFDPSMGVEAARRLTLEAELRAAAVQGDMLVHYQPVVDMQTGAIVGAEALARWEHPSRGLLGPSEFIQIAERTGAVIPLDRNVLLEACNAAMTFIDGSRRPLRISVNISSRQFQDADGLLAGVREALGKTGIDPGLLTLEITESSLLEDLARVKQVVRRLRDMGVNVALDDFGTGYSSLTYLKDIPVNALKIDRSFVSALDDAASAAVIRAILEIARDLDMTVVAEGVETQEQMSTLLALGCRYVQGFHFGEAIPEGAFRRLVQTHVPAQRSAAGESPTRSRSVSSASPPHAG